MLVEITKKKESLNLSVIRGGLDTGHSGVCADCNLCGTTGNDSSFTADKSA